MRFVKNILLVLALCCNNIECMTYDKALDNLSDSIFGNNINKTQINYIDSIKALGILDNSFDQEYLDSFLKILSECSVENKNQLCKLFVNLLKCNSKTPDIINEEFADMLFALLEFNTPKYDYSSVSAKYDKLSEDMKLLGSIIHYLLFTDKADLKTRIKNTTNLLLTDFPRDKINEQANIQYDNLGPLSINDITQNSNLSLNDYYEIATCNRNIIINDIAAPNKQFTKKVRGTFNKIFSDAHKKYGSDLFREPTTNLSKIYFNESDSNYDYIKKEYIDNLVNFVNVWNKLKTKLKSIDFTNFLQSYVLLVNKLYVNNKSSSPFELSKYFIEDNAFRYVTTDKIKKCCPENCSDKELSNEYINNVYKKLSVIKCPRNITRLLQRLSSNSNLTNQQKINIGTLIAYNIDSLNNNTKTLFEKYTKDSEPLVSDFSKAQHLFNALIYSLIKNYEETSKVIDDIKNNGINNIGSLLDMINFDEKNWKKTYNISGPDLLSRNDISKNHINEFIKILKSLDLKKIYKDFIITADEIVNIYNDPFYINPKTLEEYSKKYKDLSNFIMTHNKYHELQHNMNPNLEEDDNLYIYLSYCLEDHLSNNPQEVNIEKLLNIENAAQYYDMKYFKETVLKKIQDSDNLSELFYTICENLGYNIDTFYCAYCMNPIWRYYAQAGQRFRYTDIYYWLRSDNTYKLLSAIIYLFLENPEEAETVINNLKEIDVNNKNENAIELELKENLETIKFNDVLKNVVLVAMQKWWISISNILNATSDARVGNPELNKPFLVEALKKGFSHNEEVLEHIKTKKVMRSDLQQYVPQITIKDWNYMVHIINKYKLINIIKEFIGTANIFYKVYEYNNKVKK